MVFLLLVSVLFRGPLTILTLVPVSVGGKELKWYQLAHHQLMSQPSFSPHSTAKINGESTNLKKNGI